MVQKVTFSAPTVADEIARLRGWIEAKSLELHCAHLDLKSGEWRDAVLAKKCLRLARLLGLARQRLAMLLVACAPKKG